MYWEGYREIANFTHSWCECKTFEKHQAVPQNGICIELPYSPAIALPGTRGKSARIHAKCGTRMSSAASFIIAKKMEPTQMSINKQMGK